MVTEVERDAAYHCGIGDLLRVAYLRDFSMMEMGKCKTKFQAFNEWYQTLNEAQRQRVDGHLSDHFKPWSFGSNKAEKKLQTLDELMTENYLVVERIDWIRGQLTAGRTLNSTDIIAK